MKRSWVQHPSPAKEKTQLSTLDSSGKHVYILPRIVSPFSEVAGSVGFLLWFEKMFLFFSDYVSGEQQCSERKSLL